MRLQPVAGRRSQGAPAADHPRASGGGFRSRVRSRALFAVRRYIRPIRYRIRIRSICGRTEAGAAQLAQRSPGHPGGPATRSPPQRTRSRLAVELPPARRVSPRFRRCQFEAKQRLFAWCIASTLKPQLAIEDRADPVIEAAGRRLAISFADYWRPTAANYWGRAKKAHGLAIGREILGDRWARDHADDKKPVLAAALETAFDLNKSSALHRSRPSRARHRRRVAPARHGLWRRSRLHRRRSDPRDTTRRTSLRRNRRRHRVGGPPGLSDRRPAGRHRAERRRCLTRIFGTRIAHRRARGLRLFSACQPLNQKAQGDRHE